jgi:tetratricopeptide (TPR) repeat protein
MAEFDQLLWALDNDIQPRDFERMCVDLLAREGYRHINPIGGTKDHGRDAEFRCWSGASDGGSVVVFQFSLQQSWEKKLREDAEKITAHCPNAVTMVFVSSQAITGSKQDQLRAEFKSQHGWDFIVYHREWLRHRLTEFHHDLAKKYLGLELPASIGYATTLIDLPELDEESFKEAFRQTSPELVRTSILESTRKEPSQIANWYRLAQIDYLLRNYDGALEAITKALQLNPQDPVKVMDMTNLKGAVLAELGQQKHSRPLMIEARTIFKTAVEKLNRAVDHFNLANVLSALGDTKEAAKHYLRCLELNPDYAEAWKNSGTLFLQNGERDKAMECFDMALHYKPNLVEAHLSKATAFLLFFERADEAIRCFELAYKISPELDRRWKHGRYWFSKALMDEGRDEEALNQVENGLLLRPDDTYLLNQKAVALTKLGKKSEAYEEKAVQFLEFRAHAIPYDYSGLGALIEILTKRGCPERAWASIEANLVCKPFSLRVVAEQAELPLADFQAGFRNARLYRTFRRKFSLEDHCVRLHGYGLSPSTTMLRTLNHALIAPFGVLAREIRRANELKIIADMQLLFSATFNTIGRLFPLFGPHWLASTKPQAAAERFKLLSLGIVYLADIVAAETARLVAFTASSYGVPEEIVREGQKEDWSKVCAEIGVRLLQQVAKDWDMVKQK